MTAAPRTLSLKALTVVLTSCSPKDNILVESEANISLSGLALAVLASWGLKAYANIRLFIWDEYPGAAVSGRITLPLTSKRV